MRTSQDQVAESFKMRSGIKSGGGGGNGENSNSQERLMSSYGDVSISSSIDTNKNYGFGKCN
jgi:hypothetical protein